MKLLSERSLTPEEIGMYRFAEVLKGYFSYNLRFMPYWAQRTSKEIPEYVVIDKECPIPDVDMIRPEDIKIRYYEWNGKTLLRAYAVVGNATRKLLAELNYSL